MNWDAIGAVGEIVGAAAVLLSLIYLARQIKQSAEVGKTQSYHQALSQTLQSALHPDWAELIARDLEGEALTAAEQTRLDGLVSAFLYSHEIMMHLNRRGQIDDVLWDNMFQNNLELLRLPTVTSAAEARPGPLSAELVHLIRDGVVR